MWACGDLSRRGEDGNNAVAAFDVLTLILKNGSAVLASDAPRIRHSFS